METIESHLTLSTKLNLFKTTGIFSESSRCAVFGRAYLCKILLSFEEGILLDLFVLFLFYFRYCYAI